MASERQIAANRGNARRSTGPRSQVGKKRVSQNAFRHGLSMPLAGTELTEQIDALARQIAGEIADGGALELARTAAEAEFELARVRRVRLALIERVSALGSLKTPTHFRSAKDEVRWLIAMDNWMIHSKGPRPRRPRLKDPAATLPASEPHRSSEAIRRLLPDLIKLDGYEARAVGRRDRAIRKLSASNLGGLERRLVLAR